MAQGDCCANCRYYKDGHCTRDVPVKKNPNGKCPEHEED